MARPKTDRTKITLRMPPSIHGEIQKSAADNGRSLNAEIVQRLKASFEGYRKL